MTNNALIAGTALALALAGTGCAKRATEPTAAPADAAAPSSSAASAGLSVCIDTSSPVAAMDRRLAEAVAGDQGVDLAVHEFDGSGNDDEGFVMSNFVAMAADKCQLVLGFPLRDDSSGLPGGLRATAPYGHTSFVLVVPAQGGAQTLRTLPAGTRVAVTYNTMPNTWFVRHPALKADVRLSDAAAVEALERGEVQAALLWRPAAALQLAKDGQSQRFATVEVDEPHAHYTLAALYADAGAAAAKRFEASIERLRGNGDLAALLQPFADAVPSTTALAATAEAGVDADSGTSTEAGTTNDTRADAGTGTNGPSADAAAEDAAASPAAAGSPPALYTAAQAASGKTHYDAQCALCHGDTLAGRAGPALKGKHFAPASGKFKVKDVFAIVHKNMPAQAPGSLPKETYVEIMAYLLEQNGYPSGDAPLTFNAAGASTVPLVYAGP